MSARPPAPRDAVEAFALALPGLQAFTYRWDAAAKKWRDPSQDGRATDFAEVWDAALTALREAAEAPEPPLVLRAVYASSPGEAARLADVVDWAADQAARHAAHTEERRRAWEADEERKRRALALLARDTADLDPVTFARRGEAERARAAGRLDPAPFHPPSAPAVVGVEQRERWLQAITPYRVRQALYRASGLPALRYTRTAGRDFERQWLASLPRVPGSRVTTADFRRAYEAALPAGLTPLHDRALKALAVEVLGDGVEARCRKRTSAGWVYLDVQLPGALRLLSPIPESA